LMCVMQGAALHPEANAAVESVQTCSGDANTCVAGFYPFARDRTANVEIAKAISGGAPITVSTCSGGKRYLSGYRLNFKLRCTPYHTPAGVFIFVVSISYLHQFR